MVRSAPEAFFYTFPQEKEMSQQELIELAKTSATNHGLDPALICAIVELESSWNPWSIRYEPNFYFHYIRPMANFTATEAYAKSVLVGSPTAHGGMC
jgi:hypothetical protein